MIGLIDYGAGNLKSVAKALIYLGDKAGIIDRPGELNGVDKLILPGVGSFGPAMQYLCKGGWLEPLAEWINNGRPFLGICLGMQLLFDGSEESSGTKGLSVFGGTCLKFQAAKVPQIGWNNISFQKEDPLFSGIPDGEYFYFVHGYHVRAGDRDVVLATAEYSLEYPVIVGRKRIYGVQFHPEKSGPAGLKLLDNWRRLC
jgi:imidazole glycerol-phosphate synthase subunit HisH